MSKKSVHPIIISGGNGTRLWPLSRKSFPKQFLNLTHAATSLLQSTIHRALQIQNQSVNVDNLILIGNQDHRFLMLDQISDVSNSVIYLEPEGRNTAPAIALSAFHCAYGELQDPDALLLILPADHVINDSEKFIEAVRSAIPVAEQGYLVSFGIKPNAAETGYGYIKKGNRINSDECEAFVVNSFVEKPNLELAQEYIKSSDFFWNSGIFMFKASVYLEELKKYRLDIFEVVLKSWESRSVDLDFVRPDRELFLNCPSESIDYAVMQSTSRAAVIPVDIEWSDVGSWDALWEVSEKDDFGNSVQGDVFLNNAKNNYVRSNSRLVAMIGVDDLVVVDTPDALLVIGKGHSQDVKRIINYLQDENRKEHLEHRRVYRPWGWYEGIDSGERFQVKRIMVVPGGTLSLQMHHHRAEHWIVVSGVALVTVAGKEKLLTENQSTYINIGEIHRLKNPGKIPLHLIEVQSGAYLGEDDIVRYQDDYGRVGLSPKCNTPQLNDEAAVSRPIDL